MTLIHHGMTADQVLEILGEPSRRDGPVAMTLHYSSPGGDGEFRARIVAIDPQDRVCDIIAYQFFD